MRRKLLTRFLGIVLLAGTAAGKADTPPKPALTPFVTPVPTTAPQPDRWTTLICHFDKDSFDADYAAAKAEAGGFFDMAKTRQPGKFGKSAFIGPEWGLLIYYAPVNVNTAMGSADFWIKSGPGKNIWSDGRPHYLLDLHSAGWEEPEMMLIKTAKNKLILGYIDGYTERNKLRTQIEIPTENLAAGQWHHMFVAWDIKMNRYWLAVNGRGHSAKVAPALDPLPGEARALYVGGKRYAYHLRETADAFIDELRVTCRSPGWLAKHPPKSIEAETGFSEQLLTEMTRRVRKRYLRFMESQRFGGWGGSDWPLRGKKGQYWMRSWKPPGATVNPGKAHGGTTLIAAWCLLLYEAMQEQWLYDVAAKTGEMLLATQDKEGWWRTWPLKVTPGGLEYDLPQRTPRTLWIHNFVNLDDLVQAKAMFLLCYLYRVGGDKRFLEGAVRSADFVLKAQNPNGGWGHKWHTKFPQGCGGAGRRWQASEFEDSAFTGAFYQMLVIYRFTGDEKYLKAALRAADWVVSAQLKGATRGWAEQYDKHNVPTWGRGFEPPACTTLPTREACEGLLAAWLISRDDKYMKPIETCVQWARSVKHRKGNKFYWYYDVKTGRPIAAFKRKIYFMDDPDGVAAFKKATPRIKRGTMTKTFDIDRWTRILKEARTGTLKPHCPLATRKDVIRVLQYRKERPMTRLVGRLRAAAILKGEIPFRPTLSTFSGNWHEWPFWAWPYPDLYEKVVSDRPGAK